MGSTASIWTTVTTLTEAPQYISPFEVYSNLTLVWLDWSASFSLNGLLRDYSLTDNNLRVYIGFHSYLYIPRTSEKTLSLQVTCTTDIGSASTPIIRYSPATGMSPVEPTPGGKQGVGTQGAPVYSEMWFILLLVFLGLLVLAVLLGLVLRRALRKEPFIRERPPLVPLQKRSQAGGDAYMRPYSDMCSKHHASTLLLTDLSTVAGLTDSKIVGGGSRFSPMSVLPLAQPITAQPRLLPELPAPQRQSADRTGQEVSDGREGTRLWAVCGG
ncbi:usherin isoform X2 [Salvelinus sp. IW2-2015]|uniref:usherin isoform X2 n=1 Tax=Salvelinus sp. IW2-2015 TaxID=2691554 RepID=UPI0038D3B05C